MSLRTWLRGLYGLTGSGQPSGPPPGGSTAYGAQQAQVPGASSPVLQQALAQAVIPANVQQALQKYRTEAKRLDAGKEGAYRAGALEQAQEVLHKLPLPTSLGATLAVLQELFADCADIIFRGLLIGGTQPALLIFIDGMVQAERLELSVLGPLTHWGDLDTLPPQPDQIKMWLEANATAAGDTGLLQRVGDVVNEVLAGDAVLLMDGANLAVKFGIPGWEQRAIDEPPAEAYIRGPRDGFNETLRTNTALVRRRLRSPHLKMELFYMGRRSRTPVQMLYLKDVASPDVVAEMRRRLQRVVIDGLLDTGMLEEFLEDQPTSLFPQINNTERPDRVAAGLLEGQVAVLVDGSPSALLAPAPLWSFLYAGEDYYERHWIGSFLLWLRYLFLLIALTAPALYVAVTTFHAEMLPTSLLLSVSAAREGIPLPALVEIFLMEIFFESLREAGVRLPRPVGQAVSIVGALVIGEAAVRAGLASAPVVIVVASTGIASFTFPRFSLGIAFRLLRFPMIFLAGSLGLFGVMVGLIAILIHLCALRTLGVPYLQPLSPFNWSGMKELLIRAPIWLMGRRMPGLGQVNPDRGPSRSPAGGTRP